jgi:hypothetical protein
MQSVDRQWIAIRKVNKTLTQTRLKLFEGENFFISRIQSSWQSYLFSSNYCKSRPLKFPSKMLPDNTQLASS